VQIASGWLLGICCVEEGAADGDFSTCTMPPIVVRGGLVPRFWLLAQRAQRRTQELCYREYLAQRRYDQGCPPRADDFSQGSAHQGGPRARC